MVLAKALLGVGDILEVVGGASKGGILVRAGRGTASEELPERLATGSLVQVLEYVDGRVHFDLVSGEGPSSGWASTHFHDKVLLARKDQGNVADDVDDVTAESEALRWYGQLFSADVAEQTSSRQLFEWTPGAVQVPCDVREALAKDLGHNLAEQQQLGPEKELQQDNHQALAATFGYPAGSSKSPCYARFDIRDEACLRVGGFKHGHVVSDKGASNRELVVVGVKIDPQIGEERLWVQPQDGTRCAIPLKTEEVSRLAPVYKGLTQSIRKRSVLSAVSPSDFDAVEDSDGEAVLLCAQCNLPVGTNVYSDESGNPLHGECMAQRVQCQMREKEAKVRSKVATEKEEARNKYCIGWRTECIPSNAGPAHKLGLDAASKGMCCLMVHESSEGRAVSVVPTVDPAAAINFEYLSLALKVRFTEGREPTFSLDPLVNLSSTPEVQAEMQVKNFEPKWLSGTSAGEVLFQSDYHLKELSMGEYEQPIVGMKSCFDYSAGEAVEWHAREWYVVRKAEMHLSEDNVLIPYLKMGVEAREQVLGAEGLEDKPISRPDHPLVKYAQSFTENFDLIAERKSVVYRLRELAKASLLAKFLLESEVHLEDSWLNLASDVDHECCMEIPQLWNERCLTQIQVRDGKITDSAKLASSQHHGVYGGVKFGLDRFRLAASVTSRPGLRAVPSVARAVMPSLSMSDVRSMGMLVASMQGRGAAPPEAAVEAVAPGVVARPSVGLPSMALRGVAPMGAAPVRPGATTGQLARQLQGMLVSEPGLDGRRARLDVPSLHGVDLNLDNFNLEQTVRTGSQAAGGELAGVGISKAFWADLDRDSDSIFSAEDKKFLREVFNPCLSDRRDEGEQFMPPDPSSAYVEKLRSLVEKEEKIRQERKKHFFSSQFLASQPGPLFPFSWNPTCEIRSSGNQEALPHGSQLQPRPDYLAQAGMFDHILKSSLPVFDKSTEDGLRFRVYKAGNLDLRTTQQHNGQETVGAVFSVLPSMQASVSPKIVHEHEKIAKVTEFVEAAQGMPSAAYRRSYIMLTTEDGNQILTEKLTDGTVSWQENPENLEDRNSMAKVIRSGSCSLSKKATVTVSDMKAFKGEVGKQRSSHSASKHYAQGVFGRARGLDNRRSSGFGSRAAWHKGVQAKTIQKEARKEKLRAEINAKRAAAERETKAKLCSSSGKKVIDPVVVGSWDDWTYGSPMAFDQQNLCYSAELQMGDAGRESFQILCDNDWDLCLHPDQDDSFASEKHTLCGPDNKGHGKNWTIGLHEDHQCCKGVVYRIVLKVDATGCAESVAWERLGQL